MISRLKDAHLQPPTITPKILLPKIIIMLTPHIKPRINTRAPPRDPPTGIRLHPPSFGFTFSKHQSRSGFRWMWKNCQSVWMSRTWFTGVPASRRRTLTLGSSERREATTLPALPEPTTMTERKEENVSTRKVKQDKPAVVSFDGVHLPVPGERGPRQDKRAGRGSQCPASQRRGLGEPGLVS